MKMPFRSDCYEFDCEEEHIEHHFCHPLFDRLTCRTLNLSGEEGLRAKRLTEDLEYRLSVETHEVVSVALYRVLHRLFSVDRVMDAIERDD